MSAVIPGAWGWEAKTSYLPTRGFQSNTEKRNIIHHCDTMVTMIPVEDTVSNGR